MSKQKISIVNGIEIFAEINENGIFVPIRPICNALGIDHAAQAQRIKRHRKLSSTGVVITTVAEDEKQREMICLPLKYIYGWLFSIDLSMVSKESLSVVERYQDECYDVLYNHFTGSLRHQLDANAAEIKYLKAINDAISREKEAKADRLKAEKSLAQVRASRLDSSPCLEFE